MEISKDILYVGVNDHKIDLFEGQYKVPNGMAYNSYVILDEKIAVMDTVDQNFTHEWLDNIDKALNGRNPDYLVVLHMEPDHSANVLNFVKNYPHATVVGNSKTKTMLQNFFHNDFANFLEVKEYDTLNLGKHNLTFVFAPMVHWPEVMVAYEAYEKVLFSADAFGKFGANDVEEDFYEEGMRYYIGIVGKYGKQVLALLDKAKDLEIKTICSLHGPILKENLGYYLDAYKKWASYEPVKDGVAIFYTSVYGNTKLAVKELEKALIAESAPEVKVFDLARTDLSVALYNAFKYPKIVLATTTYNASIYPFMNDFLERLVEHNFCNRHVSFIENGSWAPMAYKIMKTKLEKCSGLEFDDKPITIKSAMSEQNKEEIKALAANLCQDYLAKDDDKANKNDMKALFKIGYGLYVVTSNDGKRDNGLIVNSVSQIANNPDRIAVTINKSNYSCHVINQTKKLNVCCLSIDVPFKVFEDFGFRSGRNTKKFESVNVKYSDNGLPYLDQYINAFMSLEVDQVLDLGSHLMFICNISEARVINDKETVTYTYYQNNIKPKPQTEGKKGFVCKVCGYVYEGEELPEDFICPLCKHGASDFEPIN